jgi:hypothetical protein
MLTTNPARCVPVFSSFAGNALPVPSTSDSLYPFALQPSVLPALPQSPPLSNIPMQLYYGAVAAPTGSSCTLSPESLASSTSSSKQRILLDHPDELMSAHCPLDVGVGSPAELSSDRCTDEQQSLNSSGDQGPAAFNRGVAGASSPLNPLKYVHRSSAPLSHSSASFHPQTLPAHFQPLSYGTPFADQALSSSMKALLQNRNTIDYTAPPSRAQIDPIDSIDAIDTPPKVSTPDVPCHNIESAVPTSTLNTVKQPSDHLLLPTLLPTHAQQKPLLFNMDHVRYVSSVPIAEQVVLSLINNQQPQMVSITCESDCGLTDRIDLLSIAIAPQQKPGTVMIAHPQVYVFDVRARSQLMHVLRPLLASQHVLKVMFDARLVLRLLRRVYNVQVFVALFDAQLAFRLLNSHLSGCPFARQKRDELMRVAWQCNAPSVNFHRPAPRPGSSSSASSSSRVAFVGAIDSECVGASGSYWSSRPVTAQLLYHAGHEAFVLVPQLAVNLMAMMELVLNEHQKRLFRDLSDQLICRHLVSRPFRQFAHRTQYLHELQTQVSLLTASASVDRLGQLPALTADCDLHSSHRSAFLSPSKRLGARLCGHKDRVGCDENCLPIDQFNRQWQSMERNRWTFDQSNHGESLRKKGTLNEKWPSNLQRKCDCDPNTTHQVKSELKCMNLLVDQIIDLIEMKDDFLTQDGGSS